MMDIVPALSRWVHLMAAVMWLGLLYYFIFVQAPALTAARADGTATGITRHIAPRALTYFRWASVLTWLSGAALLGQHFADAFLLRPGYLPIGVGAWIGTVMLINVWVLIWPCQKIILGMTPADEARKARAHRIAMTTSRINLILSFPLLFFMGAGAHPGIFFGA